MQLVTLNGGDRRQRPENVEILFDQSRARQAEMSLDLHQLLKG
jgi:hypothetical protein